MNRNLLERRLRLSHASGGGVGGGGVKERLRAMGCDVVELLQRMRGRDEKEGNEGCEDEV